MDIRASVSEESSCAEEESLEDSERFRGPLTGQWMGSEAGVHSNVESADEAERSSEVDDEDDSMLEEAEQEEFLCGDGEGLPEKKAVDDELVGADEARLPESEDEESPEEAGEEESGDSTAESRSSNQAYSDCDAGTDGEDFYDALSLPVFSDISRFSLEEELDQILDNYRGAEDTWEANSRAGCLAEHKPQSQLFKFEHSGSSGDGDSVGSSFSLDFEEATCDNILPIIRCENDENLSECDDGSYINEGVLSDREEPGWRRTSEIYSTSTPCSCESNASEKNTVVEERVDKDSLGKSKLNFSIEDDSATAGRRTSFPAVAFKDPDIANKNLIETKLTGSCLLDVDSCRKIPLNHVQQDRSLLKHSTGSFQIKRWNSRQMNRTGSWLDRKIPSGPLRTEANDSSPINAVKRFHSTAGCVVVGNEVTDRLCPPRPVSYPLMMKSSNDKAVFSGAVISGNVASAAEALCRKRNGQERVPKESYGNMKPERCSMKLAFQDEAVNWSESETLIGRARNGLGNDCDAAVAAAAATGVGEPDVARGSTGSEEGSAASTADTSTSRREKRRARILQEIQHTEGTYQHHLQLVVKYFEEPMRENKVVPEHITVTLFSNIRQIISVNRELLEHLRTISVGEAFLKLGPFLKLYSTYANNHERALATLMEWDQKSAEFARFRRAQEEAKELDGLKLNALLITPVQRIPRYKLLLEDLLTNTPHDHPDFPALTDAVGRVAAVANHINSHIKQQDNFMRMLAIQKSLAGPTAPRILVPGRIFIKEGPLKKVSKNGGRSYERMFFLFSDLLMYAKPKLLESGAHHSYICCCILPLQHCSVLRVFGHSQGQGSLFTVKCKNETLLLYSGQQAADKWIAAIEGAILEYQEGRQTLRKVSSAKQPLRRAAIARLLRKQKGTDPLTTALRRTADKKNSPRNLKRVLREADINCYGKKGKRRGGSPGEVKGHKSSPKENGEDASCGSNEGAGGGGGDSKREVLDCLSPWTKEARTNVMSDALDSKGETSEESVKEPPESRVGLRDVLHAGEIITLTSTKARHAQNTARPRRDKGSRRRAGSGDHVTSQPAPCKVSKVKDVPVAFWRKSQRAKRPDDESKGNQSAVLPPGGDSWPPAVLKTPVQHLMRSKRGRRPGRGGAHVSGFGALSCMTAAEQKLKLASPGYVQEADLYSLKDLNETGEIWKLADESTCLSPNAAHVPDILDTAYWKTARQHPSRAQTTRPHGNRDAAEGRQVEPLDLTNGAKDSIHWEAAVEAAKSGAKMLYKNSPSVYNYGGACSIQ